MIAIGLTGDVMIGRLVDEYLDTVDSDYIWGNLLPALHSTDLNLINLEAALTTSEKEVPKVFNFKAKPERVAVLQRAAVSVANLANNHSLDYSIEGLLETLKVLKEAKIASVGAGKNLADAQKPYMTEVKGVKIGILGFTDNEPSWLATDETPGTNWIEIDENGLEKVRQAVSHLRPQVDLVILTIHWGPNMRTVPSKQFQHFARKAIEAGVDIFHGHSAHVFQGVEIYKNKVILYDTGEFVDDYYVDPLLRNDQSFFFYY